MKRLFLLFIFLVLFFSWTQAQEEILVNKKGEIRIIEQIDDEWRPLKPEEKLAYANHGEKIPFELVSGTYQRLDFFKYQFTKEYDLVMVFSQGKFLTTIETTLEKSEPRFVWYIFLIVIAIILTIIFNAILYRSKKVSDQKSVMALITFFAVLITFGATLIHLWLYTNIFVLVITFSNFGFAFANYYSAAYLYTFPQKPKNCGIYLIGFYVTAILSIFI